MAAVGVFDSGVGGLSVFQAIRQALPKQSLIYLGDSARVPYGTKSPESVRRYALQATKQLVTRDIKALVVACNTAAAVALPALQAAYPDIPVLGVIEPGAQAAVRASQRQHIAVIATEGTVQGQAYERAIQAQAPECRVQATATQMLVAMAEEGWTTNQLAKLAVAEYLDPIFQSPDAPDTLMLGCTHFPVFKQVIGEHLGAQVTVVDSAQTTANALAELLAQHDLLCQDSSPSHQFLVTDGPQRFARVAPIFLGEALASEQVELVDL